MNRYREPLRSNTIRIRKKRGELSDDGSAVEHFAVCTNPWDWNPMGLASHGCVDLQYPAAMERLALPAELLTARPHAASRTSTVICFPRTARAA